MPILFSYSIEQDFVTNRSHATIMREINRGLMRHVRDQYIKKHFADVPETRPGGAYGYERRNPKYLAWKEARVGHRIPNRLSGRMARKIKSGAVITGTQHRGRLRMTNYFPLRETRRSELEVLSREEQQELAILAVNEYARKASQPRFRRKRRRRRS